MLRSPTRQTVATLRHAVSGQDLSLAYPSAFAATSPIAGSSRLSLATSTRTPSLRAFASNRSTSPTSSLLSTSNASSLRRSQRLSHRFPYPPLQRTLATHAATLTSKPSNPEEPNVYKKGDPTILLSDRAVNQLLKIALKDREKANQLALRIAVEPGGCHGYQYKMELEEADQAREGGPGEEDDFRFQAKADSSEVAPLPILIDSISLTLLQGSTIDYVTELIGSQFAVKDNPQSKGPGCGCGVSWEPIA